MQEALEPTSLANAADLNLPLAGNASNSAVHAVRVASELRLTDAAEQQTEKRFSAAVLFAVRRVFPAESWEAERTTVRL